MSGRPNGDRRMLMSSEVRQVDCLDVRPYFARAPA